MFYIIINFCIIFTLIKTDYHYHLYIRFLTICSIFGEDINQGMVPWLLTHAVLCDYYVSEGLAELTETVAFTT